MTFSKLVALSVVLCGVTARAEPAAAPATPAQPRAPIVRLADNLPAAVADRQDLQVPDRVHLGGMLGVRIERSDIDRLLGAVDSNRLLDGFRHRPGEQAWVGEHYGKWLDAATLAWVYTGDPRLRAKIDDAVVELLKCQTDDGYLGTYTPDTRWTEWDVWVHKYDLLGLIAYVQYTGNTATLRACRKIGDLLCKEFGDKPGQRDIVNGEHVGMAPGSVLEPMVRLYRLTGEKRYGDFCKYILRAYEQPNGPKIVSRLLAHQGVNRVGNGKAYEELSCLVGIMEWYRTTGERKYLDAALNAWRDIVAKRSYITGGASCDERFRGDYDLPNAGRLCETCVAVTWMQFNLQLLRATGEARFAEQLERVVYNQLAGAQRPDGKAWGCFVEMQGKKPYNDDPHGHCCLSSGPRGMSLIPTFAVSSDADGVVVNFYDAGDAQLRLRDGREVKLHIDSAYPADGNIAITVNPASNGEFTLKLRMPAWCKDGRVSLNGAPIDATLGGDGYLSIKRTWSPREKVELVLNVEPRIIVGDRGNTGKVAVMAGPLVLAADDELLQGTGLDVEKLVVVADPAAASFERQPVPAKFRTWPKACLYVLKSAAPAPLAKDSGSATAIPLVPFADAGMTAASYKVWLPLKKK